MENNPTVEKVEGVTTEETTVAETPSSSQETDYDALIEAEQKRGPDPDKAKEAFKKRQEKRQEEEPEPEDEMDKPMTRREMEEYLARRQHDIVTESQQERIQEIATELADSDKEASYIMAIHKNRVFPDGMSLRDQLREAHYIAMGQRLAAKNVEMARKIQSKETATQDAPSTHHEPQEGVKPKLKADVAQALKRSGFEYSDADKVYVKKLPNGKKLYKRPETGETWMS